jgi:hypothetical protein
MMSSVVLEDPHGRHGRFRLHRAESIVASAQDRPHLAGGRRVILLHVRCLAGRCDLLGVHRQRCRDESGKRQKRELSRERACGLLQFSGG